MVRGQWAPLPTEGKGPRERQYMAIGQLAPPAADQNTPRRHANPRPLLPIEHSPGSGMTLYAFWFAGLFPAARGGRLGPVLVCDTPQPPPPPPPGF